MRQESERKTFFGEEEARGKRLSRMTARYPKEEVSKGGGSCGRGGFMGVIVIKWAHIAGHNCATGVLHKENVLADRKPHHPIHFPPQRVINGHLELGWEGQSGHGSQQAFSKTTHQAQQ